MKFASVHIFPLSSVFYVLFIMWVFSFLFTHYTLFMLISTHVTDLTNPSICLIHCIRFTASLLANNWISSIGDSLGIIRIRSPRGIILITLIFAIFLYRFQFWFISIWWTFVFWFDLLIFIPIELSITVGAPASLWNYSITFVTLPVCSRMVWNKNNSCVCRDVAERFPLMRLVVYFNQPFIVIIVKIHLQC